MSFQRGLLDDVDPYLTVVLGASLLVHMFLFGYFKWWSDPPRALPPDEIPDQFARFSNERAPVLPAVEAEPGAGGEETAAAKAERPKPARPKQAPAPTGGSPSQVTVAQKVANSAPIKVLAGAGGDASSPFFNVTGGRDDGEDLQKGLDRVGKTAGVIDLGGGVRDGNAGGAIEERQGPVVAGPTAPKSTGGAKADEQIQATGETDELTGDESGALNPEVFAEVLQKRWYPQALKCYERILRINPGIHGKVEIKLTVGVTGGVTQVDASGFHEDVDTCIEAAARTWRFPKPEQPSTFEFVFIFRAMRK